MSEVSYATGTWLAMAGQRTWLLVDMAEDTDLASRCWSLVRDDAEVDQILGMILHEGFRAIRHFALVRRSGDGWRCCVRGNATVTSDGSLVVTGNGAATWVDRDLGETAGVVVAPGEPVDGDVVRYPLMLGVVPASTMWIGTVSVAPQPERRQALVPAPSLEQPPESAPQVAENVSRFFGVAQTAPEPPEEEYFTELPELAAAPRASTWTTPEVAPLVTSDPPPSPGFIADLPWAARVEVREPVQRPRVTTSTDELDETMLRPQPTDAQRTEQGEVRAVRCPSGHLSADTAHSCRVCAASIPPQQAVTVTRPVLGVLRLSTGDEITLDRGVLMGRAPNAPADAALRTHLVRISDDKEISRNHLEILLDGWDVLVVDLGAKNGTELHHVDGRCEPLDAHTPTVLRPGVRVVLDPHTYFTFEVCP